MCAILSTIYKKMMHVDDEKQKKSTKKLLIELTSQYFVVCAPEKGNTTSIKTQSPSCKILIKKHMSADQVEKKSNGLNESVQKDPGQGTST
jgi:hypothetical protein